MVAGVRDIFAGNIILGSRIFSPIGGLGLVLPAGDIVELGAAIEAGPVVSFVEDPSSGGESNGGFTIGGGASARFWLSDFAGILVDARFDMLDAKRKGATTRHAPAGETLSDVEAVTKDLRTSIGVCFRL